MYNYISLINLCLNCNYYNESAPRAIALRFCPSETQFADGVCLSAPLDYPI
jgi:hypothetical protein